MPRQRSFGDALDKVCHDYEESTDSHYMGEEFVIPQALLEMPVDQAVGLLRLPSMRTVG